MNKKIVSLLIVLILPIFGISADKLGLFWLKGNFAKIVGKVISENKEPIKGAIIVIPETGDSVETNSKGIFSILVPKKMKIHIEIYRDGFAPYITNFFKIRKRIEIPVIFSLMESLQESITVTATASEKKLLDIPVKTYVISQKMIEAKTPINLADALKFTTGVKVETDCQNCNYTQVRLNGLEGKYTQILIDGLPIISSLASVYGLEQIPSEMIERIEIVKGGSSSLYGGNAIGGVINLITRESFENQTSFNFQGESILGKPYIKVGFINNYISEDKQTKSSIFATYYNRQPVDVNMDGFSNLGLLNDTAFGINLFKYFQEIKGKLKLSFTKINEYRRGGDHIELPPQDALIAEMARTNRVDTNLMWEQFFGNDVLKFALSYTFLKRSSYYGAGKDPNAFGETKNPVMIGIFHYFHKIKTHTLTFGLSYRAEKLNDKALAYKRIIDDRYKNFGIMFQDDFQINKKTDLLYGIRVDKHSKVKKIITSPRVSLMLNITKKLKTRTTISTGFRAPQVFDEDLHITILGGEGFIVKNSPNLKEERSYSLTHSFDFYSSSKNKAFQFSLGFFYNRLLDTFVLREIAGNSNSRVFLRENGKGLEVYGAEIDVGYKIASLLELNFGWTLQKSYFDIPEPNFNSKIPFKTPESYGFATLLFNGFKYFDFDLDFEYNGSMKMPHYKGYIEKDTLETTPPYFILSSSVKKSIKIKDGIVDLFVKVYNITNEFQEDIDKGAFRDAGYIYGPSKPRSYIFGIKYKF